MTGSIQGNYDNFLKMNLENYRRNLHSRVISMDSSIQILNSTLRCSSNQRAQSVSRPITSSRVPLIELRKPKHVNYKKFNTSIWKNSRIATLALPCKDSKKYFTSNRKFQRPGQQEDKSLVIGSLIAVSKQVKINPTREKLLRLFNSQRKVEENNRLALANCNDYREDDCETPSPCFLSKYKHQ